MSRENIRNWLGKQLSRVSNLAGGVHHGLVYRPRGGGHVLPLITLFPNRERIANRAKDAKGEEDSFDFSGALALERVLGYEIKVIARGEEEVLQVVQKVEAQLHPFATGVKDTFLALRLNHLDFARIEGEEGEQGEQGEEGESEEQGEEGEEEGGGYYCATFRYDFKYQKGDFASLEENSYQQRTEIKIKC